MPYRGLVVGTDASEHSERARDVAIELAEANAAALTFVHAGNRDSAADLLERAERAAAARELQARTDLREEAASDALVEAAEAHGADLIVVGSRGTSGSRVLRLGSVAMRVAHHAPCDVLIVRSGAPERYRSVLVCTDGSVTADRCAQKGYDIAGTLGARITALFVGHPATGELVLEDTHRSLAEDGEVAVDVDKRIEQGDPAEVILDVATQDSVDLIVLGNKGMSGKARFLLGSVPQKVALYSDCDVLIARTDTQPLDELAPGDGGVVKVAGRNVAIYRDDSGQIHAVTAKCTHMGCTVGWNPREKTWDCPCHGSRYDTDGAVINGPATQPLRKTML